MAIESATYISDLVSTNPLGGDSRKTSDDHHRLVKAVLKSTFPNASAAINPSVAEFNYLVGVTSLIQTQLDGKLGVSPAASAIVNTAAGDIVATDVQAAIDELDTEKEPSLTAATKLEMEAGTVTALRSMTPERIKEAIVALEISEGFNSSQTWQDMSASRSLSTNYTNSTGAPILVMVTYNSRPSGVQATVSGLVVGYSYTNDAAYASHNCLTFIVPDGEIYSVTASGARTHWKELR